MADDEEKDITRARAKQALGEALTVVLRDFPADEVLDIALNVAAATVDAQSSPVRSHGRTNGARSESASSRRRGTSRSRWFRPRKKRVATFQARRSGAGARPALQLAVRVPRTGLPRPPHPPSLHGCHAVSFAGQRAGSIFARICDG
jgi:hypothetical protein